MMLGRDRIGALLLLAFTVAYGALTFEIPLLAFQAKAAFTARTMPQALAVLGGVLALILLVKPGSDAGPEVAGFQWGQAGLICLLMVAYGFTVRPGGFLVSTAALLSGGIVILGERRWWLVFAVAVPVVVLFWLLMTQLLGVYIEPWPTFLEE